ncbi:ankyrin repeat domain-containing protein [Nocardia sp. NPDC004068]|uniref:ankyrin repeat domain-containing protein n=1 Tax=Nocardia sp. NPDC004068 TaxID=3364303 RepID=UPI00368C5C1D
MSNAERDPEAVELASRMFEAARAGDAATVGAYLDAGVPVNLTNERGDTLVMLAAYHGRLAALRTLLDRGADPDRANDRGQTPLAGAIFKGEPEIVRVLLAAGADPDAGTPSAREAAVMFEKTELLLGTG